MSITPSGQAGSSSSTTPAGSTDAATLGDRSYRQALDALSVSLLTPKPDPAPRRVGGEARSTRRLVGQLLWRWPPRSGRRKATS
jgi:hypothetical protein